MQIITSELVIIFITSELVIILAQVWLLADMLNQ